MTEKRIQFKEIVKNQLPQYVREDFPLIGEFLSQYYLAQEFQGAPIDLIQNIDKYVKVDSITNQVDYTVLGSDISEIDENITISLLDSETGTDGFPDKYGLILVDDEIIVYESKTFGSFNNCYRGFSGVVSYKNTNVGVAATYKLNSTDQLIFKVSESDSHSSGTKIYNLSNLFLKEFLIKTKYQLSPGFEERTFVDKVNKATLIKQIKDFYRSKGTDQSFQILFKALYGERVEILRPKDFLFRPSDAHYKVTNNLVVENISGNIENIVDLTLFQDEYLNISKSYGTISEVETVNSDDGRTFYKLKIDGGYNRDPAFDGAIYGKFSVHPKTRVIGNVPAGSSFIDVDSTVGFPNKGELSATFSDGTTGVVSYTSKNLTQFLGCSNISLNIEDNSAVGINTYAYAKTNSGEEIRVKINSILDSLNISDDNFYYSKDDTAQIRTLGYKEDSDYRSNDWIINVSPTYDVKSIELVDASDQTYNLILNDRQVFSIGDSLKIINSSQSISNSIVVDVLSENIITVKGQGQLSDKESYKVKREILKVNTLRFPEANNSSANVQNVYKDGTKNLIASPSIPFYPNQTLDVSDRSVIFSGTFVGDTFAITSLTDHGFYTGDAVYYTPEKTISVVVDADGNSSTVESVSGSIFDEGIYYIKRIDNNNVKFARGKSDILNNKYLSLDNQTTVTNSRIEPYEFYQKTLQSQKLLREISVPVITDKSSKTNPGFSGMLVNGVEILNYKGRDRIIYGSIEEVEVLGSGSGYDVIDDLNFTIQDSVGFGATGYCSVSGSLSEIRIVDPGFDYVETPTIKIIGGNGIGAKAKANMKLITHQVYFNSEQTSNLVGIGSTVSTIGFSTSHKFRNGENVIYKTDSQKAISGLTTNATYYVSTVSPTVIKLHRTLGDALSGINTISLNDYGIGNHSLESINKKSVLASINVEDPGLGYQNRKTSVTSVGINTSIDSITIANHGYSSGEIVTYTTEGTPIGGLSSGTNYYLTKIDNDSFRLSQVGSGNYSEDFFYRTRQYVNITSTNSDLHFFNYPAISVELIGNVGVSSEYKAQIQPVFRGEIQSIHLTFGGSSYGVEDIFNIERQPVINIESGSGAEFNPIISNGQIVQVLVDNVGKNYTSSPILNVSGNGFGAVLTPIVVNGQIVEVKVIDGGVGYSKDSTTITATSSGSGASFRAKIKTWTVNLFQKYFTSITEDDGFLVPGLNPEYGIQYSHIYAPRKLRELLFSRDQSGKILYSNPDLGISNNAEISSSNHSPIIGWSYDGHPIYGPYGYSRSSGGVVAQMKSGYRLNIKENRPSLNYFPEGFFVEDYSHYESNDETVLDENNGRFCITPEFPNGTYAYFATIETRSTDSSGPFVGYKRPTFPYLIGENYKAKPNEFNFKRQSNQDDIDLNNTNWIRNTYSYNITDKNSTYEYITIPNKLSQTIDVVGVSPGYIERIGILTGGDGYKVNDSLVFDNTNINGGFKGDAASAIVSEISGKEISSVSVASSTIYDVEFYPTNVKGSYILYNDVPHNFSNFDLVSITGLSTTSSLIEGSYVAGIQTSKFSLTGLGTSTVGLSSVSVTGIVTYVNVKGDLAFSGVRENDIYRVNDEKIKVLNVDIPNSRLRILREIDGTVGTSHSVTTVLYEYPRKLVINSGFKTDYVYRFNKELYFNPSDSVAIGTDSRVGAGYTISFSNPGSGKTELFVPNGTIYLPNHELKTGDSLTYRTNGGDPISVYSVGTGNTDLVDNTILYVAKINDDLIGISTVKVGLGSTGIFAGVSSTTNNISTLLFVGLGTGLYHSFETNYNVITGQVSRNIVTVSTAQTHGLSNNDEVRIDVNPSISTSITVKYDDYNKKLLINPKNFLSGDVNISNNTISLQGHGFSSGQKVIHTSTSPSGGLSNYGAYYVIFVDENTIKLSDSYFNSKIGRIAEINITSASSGTLSLVNPPIKLYKDSRVDFDLSDSSLSYIYQSIRYPAFKFELFSDSGFNNLFEKSKDRSTFNVVSTGIVGVSSDAKLTLFVDKSLPETLYYNLTPIFIGNIPPEKEGISYDDIVISHNELQIKESLYDGNYKVFVPTASSFTYFLTKVPERLSYSSTESILKYYTKSQTAFGSISDVKITNRGVNYYAIPGITKVNSSLGSGSILEAFGSSIGKIRKTKILDIGFDFPSDYTLRPQFTLPRIVKIDSLSSFESIGISSFGRGYVSAPKLIVFDGRTGNLVPEVDLRYELGKTQVTIRNNTYGISNVTPTILPIENSNGVGIRTISYNSSNKTVTVGLSTGFSTTESFPFAINDKVLIENISVGIGSTAKGYNSKNYGYKLFTLTDVDANIGGIGSVTYSLNGILEDGEVPGTFNVANSVGRIIPEKFFPIFNINLKKNNYIKGEKVKSGNSLGVVESWDPITNYLKITSNDTFESNQTIEGLSSKTQGIASSTISFDYHANLNSTTKFNNGWETTIGFLNENQQRIQDSFYYQNFSYSIKSKIPFDTWNDAVSSLNHTVGFVKFSDLQLESKVSAETNTTLTVGVSTEVTGVDVIVDMIGYGDLNCFYDFDIARENSLKIDSEVISNEIYFNNRILTDYVESFGNRVLSIDDISQEFNSNPRPTKFSEINRFDLRSVRAQKYITYIKDKRFFGQRQAMLVTLLHDDQNAYLNQYGRVETVYDLGSFDFSISGSDGILLYYPTKYTINDYDVTALSYNIKDDLSGIGSTTIGSSVNINTSSSIFGESSSANIASFGTIYTSAKVLVEIETGNGDFELNELNIVHDGTDVQLLEYGQLTTGNIAFPSSSSGFGTYYPYISGSDVKIDFISNAGIGTTNCLNAITVSIAGTSLTGIGTLDIKHAVLESRVTNISSSATPTENVVFDYNGEYSAAYYLVQVSDTTNGRYQLSEVVMIDDDTYSQPYVTEFANLETHIGLGTIGGSITGIGETSQLLFTPIENIDVEVKVYANVLRIQDDSRNIIDLNNGTIESIYSTYFGTEKDLKRSFDLTHRSFPIFEKKFDGSSSDVVNIDDDTIEIPGHFFVTGEKIEYKNINNSQSSIGIATTSVSGIGLTDKLPSTLYAVKVNENKIKVSLSASDALSSIPNVLNLTSVGIGSTHSFTAFNQNSKVLISLDNIIQSPIVGTSQTTTLSNNAFTTDDELYFSGITSFFGGDLVRIGNEIMVIQSVGVGSTNSIRVKRSWLGTSLAGYSTGEVVTKVTGTYNIVGNTLNFVEAPYGNIPIGSITNPPEDRDWSGISAGSKFHGRTFMRSGVPNTSNETYYKNYIYDDISNNFNGTNRTFTLKSNNSNVSGISNENSIILINDVFQGPGQLSDYTLSESVGETSISFTGTASSVSYDVNTSNLPVGGIIISVGSTEGFGYQPLVSAGGTAIVSVAGTISSISIGNSGSGYRSGIQTVRVGVQTSDNNGLYIEYIGTANITNGNVVSVGVTNPGVGYTTTNPPKVIFDDPLSYSDIPLVYSSVSPTGIGTGATIDIVVGQGSNVIDFEIKNTGYGYRENQILTVQVGGSAGIPTTSSPSFTEFEITIQNVFSDKFTGWSIGELQVFDDISNLFDGETTTFPLTISGNLVSIKAAKGSNINVQDLLLVFVNDILQVPGQGYTFDGGSIITFTEAPKGESLEIPGTNDKCKILFYRGTGSVDVIDRNILETVKVGDKVILGYDSSIGQSSTLQEEDRTVTSILATDLVDTNPYFGPGNTEDESLSRTITWCRQTEDKIIDEQEISKDRMLYEPMITPSAYITKSVGIGSTIIYVDNLRPFFNPQNENNVSLSFQNRITLISQDNKVGASATAIVSDIGTIASIAISDGGSGYVSAPVVTIGSTSQAIGLGTTASASSSITSGIVTTISLSNAGTGYTISNPPVVLISPPTSVVETNNVSSYSGDSGIIVGFGTTTVSSVDKLILDLHIPLDSDLRETSLVGTAVTLSSINVGDYFIVYESNVGAASTILYSKDSTNTTIGIGSEFLDNVYEVDSVENVSYQVVGVGTTTLRRVYVRLTGFSTSSPSGFVTTSSYFGSYSWGRIELNSRSEENQFNFYGNNGLVGITSSALVEREVSLKYKNYSI